MSFRIRLLLMITLVVAAAVGLVTWSVSSSTTRAFERLDDQRTAALIAQFRREYAKRGEELVQRVERISTGDQALRLAVEVNRPEPNYAEHVDDAAALARAHGLDFLELVAHDGTIISSAQWPARFGYRSDWLAGPAGSEGREAFLKREESADHQDLALMAVREVSAGDKRLIVAGGQRLDRQFLGSLLMPAGMRALLYANVQPAFSPASLVDASGPVPAAGRLQFLIEQVLRSRTESSATIRWESGPETVQAIPLVGRDGDVLGAMLIGSSRAELAVLNRRIRMAGYLIGGAGVLFGIALGCWVAARVTRPVALLAAGAREVAGGTWDARVDIRSTDEMGQLAGAFNTMTAQLRDQRERLVQAERVAAWRELARRLAHELKNPLFPLQITVENLQRSRQLNPAQFEEVFRESTGTMLAELSKLKTIIARFSDFAKMPQPQPAEVDLNALVAETVRLFEAQFKAEGRAPISTRIVCDKGLGTIRADPEQLGRALQNLILNAIDAMPDGGTLALRTRGTNGSVVLEVSDTGQGLTSEEAERLFTPYYTTKQHGTGLGLAIVQSVVSDHKGKISVESEPGRGTTFKIELRRSLT